jgi:hypothetical protein
VLGQQTGSIQSVGVDGDDREILSEIRGTHTKTIRREALPDCNTTGPGGCVE